MTDRDPPDPDGAQVGVGDGEGHADREGEIEEVAVGRVVVGRIVGVVEVDAAGLGVEPVSGVTHRIHDVDEQPSRAHGGQSEEAFHGLGIGPLARAREHPHHAEEAGGRPREDDHVSGGSARREALDQFLRLFGRGAHHEPQVGRDEEDRKDHDPHEEGCGRTPIRQTGDGQGSSSPRHRGDGLADESLHVAVGRDLVGRDVRRP